MTGRPAVLLALLAGCAYISEDRLEQQLDPDGDGVPSSADCAPRDPAVSLPAVWFVDVDADGVGDSLSRREGCEPPDGSWSLQEGDGCDENPALLRPRLVFPDADGDGLGRDEPESSCDDTATGVALVGGDACDDVPGQFEEQIWFEDLDADGIGGEASEAGCSAPAGSWSTRTGDACDDNPGLLQAQVVYPDEDGDGVGADEPVASCDDAAVGFALVGGDACDANPALLAPRDWWVDGDGDGVGAGATVEGCDDDVPGHVLTAGDCDDGDASLLVAVPYYPDLDGDGFGAGSPLFQCSRIAPVNHAADGSDCDDDAGDDFPGAAERCDGADNDCDGASDDDDDSLGRVVVFLVDADGDAYGDARGLSQPDEYAVAAREQCAPPGTVLLDLDALDCDDEDGDSHPSHDELCDGRDNDCDGLVDEEYDRTELVVDHDGDGYPSGEIENLCSQLLGAPGHWRPGDYTGEVDCDDDEQAVSPDADEVWYDGVDQDCLGDDDFDQDADGFGVAEDCDDARAVVNPAADEVWYDGTDQDCDGNDVDFDGDGHAALVAGGEDCDDSDGALHPGAEEVWYDGVDQDCAHDDDFDRDHDGQRPELYDGTDCDDADPDTWWQAPDQPYDGVDRDCEGDDDFDADRDGYTSNVVAGGTDCDDDAPAIHPGAEETWYDGTDDDCDGRDDDADDDGFALAFDCDDLDPAVNPAASEDWADDVDEDCDDVTDDADADGEPSVAQGGSDCNDQDPQIRPGAAERGDDAGADANCNGHPGRWCAVDTDGDGYGAGQALSDTGDCASGGYVEPSALVDCDDRNASVNPGAPELCDGIDQNCDASLDEYGVVSAVLRDADGSSTAQVLDVDADGLVLVPTDFDRLEVSICGLRATCTLGPTCDHATETFSAQREAPPLPLRFAFDDLAGRTVVIRGNDVLVPDEVTVPSGFTFVDVTSSDDDTVVTLSDLDVFGDDGGVVRFGGSGTLSLEEVNVALGASGPAVVDLTGAAAGCALEVAGGSVTALGRAWVDGGTCDLTVADASLKLTSGAGLSSTGSIDVDRLTVTRSGLVGPVVDAWGDLTVEGLSVLATTASAPLVDVHGGVASLSGTSLREVVTTAAPIRVRDADVLVVDTVATDVHTDGDGGILQATGSSVSVVGVGGGGVSASGRGGIVFAAEGSAVLVQDPRFDRGPVSAQEGGLVYLSDHAYALLSGIGQSLPATAERGGLVFVDATSAADLQRFGLQNNMITGLTGPPESGLVEDPSGATVPVYGWYGYYQTSSVYGSYLTYGTYPCYEYRETVQTGYYDTTCWGYTDVTEYYSCTVYEYRGMRQEWQYGYYEQQHSYYASYGWHYEAGYYQWVDPPGYYEWYQPYVYGWYDWTTVTEGVYGYHWVDVPWYEPVTQTCSTTTSQYSSWACSQPYTYTQGEWGTYECTGYYSAYGYYDQTVWVESYGVVGDEPLYINVDGYRGEGVVAYVEGELNLSHSTFTANDGDSLVHVAGGLVTVTGSAELDGDVDHAVFVLREGADLEVDAARVSAAAPGLLLDVDDTSTASLATSSPLAGSGTTSAGSVSFDGAREVRCSAAACECHDGSGWAPCPPAP